MGLKILVAPDKFKTCLTAPEVTRAIRAGIEQAVCRATVIEASIADGGDGFSSLIAAGGDYAKREVSVSGADGRQVTAAYYIGEGRAIVESAEAIGLRRLGARSSSALEFDSYGLGELLIEASRQPGVNELVVGLGGTATNDMGCGMASALGARFLDVGGRDIEPNPGSIASALATVDTRKMIELPPIRVACDVDNPLLGATGATRVYGPQKGLELDELEVAEKALAKLVDLLELGSEAKLSGGGAAGGLGMGMKYFCNAELNPGFELFAEEVGITAMLTDVDLVITGEGCLDHQSLFGKAPVGLARLAAAAGVPTWCLCGKMESNADLERDLADLFAKMLIVLEREPDLESAVANAPGLIAEMISEALLDWLGGDSLL